MVPGVVAWEALEAGEVGLVRLLVVWCGVACERMTGREGLQWKLIVE